MLLRSGNNAQPSQENLSAPQGSEAQEGMEAAAAAVEDAKAAKAEKKSFSDQYKIVEMFDGKDIEGLL